MQYIDTRSLLARDLELRRYAVPEFTGVTDFSIIPIAQGPSPLQPVGLLSAPEAAAADPPTREASAQVYDYSINLPNAPPESLPPFEQPVQNSPVEPIRPSDAPRAPQPSQRQISESVFAQFRTTNKSTSNPAPPANAFPTQVKSESTPPTEASRIPQKSEVDAQAWESDHSSDMDYDTDDSKNTHSRGTSTDPQVPESDNKQPQPKRRGRPKGSKTRSREEREASAAALAAEGKRRPGRPPGSKNKKPRIARPRTEQLPVIPPPEKATGYVSGPVSSSSRFKPDPTARASSDQILKSYIGSVEQQLQSSIGSLGPGVAPVVPVETMMPIPVPHSSSFGSATTLPARATNLATAISQPQPSSASTVSNGSTLYPQSSVLPGTDTRKSDDRSISMPHPLRSQSTSPHANGSTNGTGTNGKLAERASSDSGRWDTNARPVARDPLANIEDEDEDEDEPVVQSRTVPLRPVTSLLSGPSHSLGERPRDTSLWKQVNREQLYYHDDDIDDWEPDDPQTSTSGTQHEASEPENGNVNDNI